MKIKNTKQITDLKEAIKAQDLNVGYYIGQAQGIISELKKDVSHRDYIYEKIRNLKELEEF